MSLRPSILSSFATLNLQTVIPRPLLWGLVLWSLCAGLTRLSQPERAPRLLNRLWGALPEYTLVVRGGDTCLRCPAGAGDGPAAGVFGDAPLDLVLRPQRPVAGPVFAHAFLRHAGRLGIWPVLLEHAEGGTLRLGGMVRDLLELPTGGSGGYELIFILQRSPLPPSPAAVQARLGSAALSVDGNGEPQLLRAVVEVLAPTAL